MQFYGLIEVSQEKQVSNKPFSYFQCLANKFQLFPKNQHFLRNMVNRKSFQHTHKYNFVKIRLHTMFSNEKQGCKNSVQTNQFLPFITRNQSFLGVMMNGNSLLLSSEVSNMQFHGPIKILKLEQVTNKRFSCFHYVANQFLLLSKNQLFLRNMMDGERFYLSTNLKYIFVWVCQNSSPHGVSK